MKSGHVEQRGLLGNIVEGHGIVGLFFSSSSNCVLNR